VNAYNIPWHHIRLHPSPAWCPTVFSLGSSLIHPVQHGVDFHSYAVDTQLYTGCSSTDASKSAVQLLRCIEEVNKWMSSNRLRLNADKTQFIWLGSPQILAKINKIPLRVGGVDVFPLDAVRDLGVIVDSKLTVKNYVDSVVRSCFYQLRQLRSIRRSLTPDAAHTLVYAFIHSRVDCCNAILVGVSDGVVRKLQSVLHAAARLVTGVCWSAVATNACSVTRSLKLSNVEPG